MHEIVGAIPRNEEEQRMIQWFDALLAADRDAEWKAPIEVYGLVVNQSNQPIAGATATMRWVALDGNTPARSVATDANGRFSISGIQGNGLCVDVEKEGYSSFRTARQSFGFLCAADHNFYVPDSNNPAIFRLWEYSNPEPMYDVRRANMPLSVDDKTHWMDVLAGRMTNSGQVGFSVLRVDPTNWLAGYTITIHAAEGGGVKLAALDDELMFEAPENGYQPEIRIVQPPGYVFEKGKILRFYLRTPDQRYAAMDIQVSQNNRGQASVTTQMYLNPSGSRNLQFRDDLRLRPPRRSPRSP